MGRIGRDGSCRTLSSRYGARRIEYDLVIAPELLKKVPRANRTVLLPDVLNNLTKRLRSIDLVEKMVLRRIDRQNQVGMLMGRVQ